ncbi:MAG: hypothetical protein ABI216_21595 [Devosia sp.]
MNTATQIIAIDGCPASPAVAAALAQIAENGARYADEKAAIEARVDADPRIARLRRMRDELHVNYRHGVLGAEQVFEGMASGRLTRIHRITKLIRARRAHLRNDVLLTRDMLREAAQAKRMVAA